MRLALATLAVVAVTPSSALAASVSVSTSTADPKVDAPVAGSVSYDTGGQNGDLELYWRGNTQPCAAAAGAEADAGSERLLARAVSATGTFDFQRTFESPGPVRFCAYITSTSNETIAAATHEIFVRELRASVEIDGIRLAGVDDGVGSALAGGGEMLVDVSGDTEGPLPLRGMLVAETKACPAAWKEPDIDLIRQTVGGTFSAALATRAIPFRRYRACVYIQRNSQGPAIVTADRVVDPRVAPIKLQAPAIVFTGLGSRTTARCSPGLWAAWPKARVAYAWKVDGRVVRRARRATLKVRPRSRVACRVTVRNAVGKKIAWSKTRRA